MFSSGPLGTDLVDKDGKNVLQTSRPKEFDELTKLLHPRGEQVFFGATVRYVTLPYEPHGYIGRESVEHVQWEMVHWFDQWVKNPQTGQSTAAAK